MKNIYIQFKEQRIKNYSFNNNLKLDNPINQYNFVVANYNDKINISDNIQLEIIKESKIYNFTYKLLKNFCGRIVISVILMFLTFFNFVIFALILHAFYFYEKSSDIYEKNKIKVPDIFIYMICAPEVCQFINRMNCYFDIESDGKDKKKNLILIEIHHFCLSIENEDKLRLKEKDGRVQFMIYDNRFWSFYNNFPKKRSFHVLWTIWGIILISLNIIFTLYFWTNLLSRFLK